MIPRDWPEITECINGGKRDYILIQSHPMQVGLLIKIRRYKRIGIGIGIARYLL